MKEKFNDVNIIDKNTVFIEENVKIGKNVIIHPNNIIKGNTIIGDNVVLMPSNYIIDSLIKEDSVIEYSYIEQSVVGKNVHIGPYSRLRPNSTIEDEVKIGNFVEVKNSKVGKGTKANHLAYIGDVDIGENCNIGCGAIFVNYNGLAKNRSKVGDNCFIGSNVNIIAPVEVADESYICAGSTLTVNTNPNDFVIARAREVIKPEYAKKYKKHKTE